MGAGTSVPVMRSAAAPWHLDAVGCSLDPDDLPPAKVVAGHPTTGVREIAPPAGVAADIGVWEHTVGTSVDVEADEVFVVLSGRATVTYDDGTRLDIGPGSVVGTPAGVHSTWTVHETLRKVYVIAP